MAGQAPRSSQSTKTTEPINPYEASQAMESGRKQIAQPNENEGRDYRARFDWHDRKNFLKSVMATRFASILGAMLSLNMALQNARYWWYVLTNEYGFRMDGLSLAMNALTALAIVQIGITLAACWLNWHYADRLQAVAGGKTTSCNEWSFLHYRIEWLNAGVCVVAAIILLGNWLLARAMSQDGLGI